MTLFLNCLNRSNFNDVSENSNKFLSELTHLEGTAFAHDFDKRKEKRRLLVMNWSK